MAQASRKKFGPGVKDKGDGTGAMTDIDISELPANTVLSNRDKSSHPEQRGLDSKSVQTDQYHAHSDNRRPKEGDEE